MPDFDGDREVGHHRQREGDQPDRLVGPVETPDAGNLAPLAHVVGHDEEDGGERRQRHVLRERRRQQAR